MNTSSAARSCRQHGARQLALPWAGDASTMPTSSPLAKSMLTKRCHTAFNAGACLPFTLSTRKYFERGFLRDSDHLGVVRGHVVQHAGGTNGVTDGGRSANVVNGALANAH